MSRGALLAATAGGLVLALEWLGRANGGGVRFLGRAGLVAGVATLLIVAIVRRFAGDKRCDLLLVNLMVLAVATLASLSGAELAVRWIYRDVTTTADNSSVFARSWKARQTSNSLGFREREFSRDKPDGVYRIAVIGDSFTFGQGIPAEDRFSNRLEKALNARAGKHAFEVLNFGRAGAETDDEIRILRDTVLPVEPDFVLLQWYANDMEGEDHSRRPRPLPLLPSTYLRRKLSERSALYFVAQSGWASLQRELGLLGSYEQYMRERFGDPKGPDSVAADAALHDFFEVCREHGVPVAAVLFPHLQAAPTYPFAEFHARVLERCEADGVPCVDLKDSLWSGERTEDMWVNPLDRHTGSEANRLAADEILERFGADWLRAESVGAE